MSNMKNGRDMKWGLLPEGHGSSVRCWRFRHRRLRREHHARLKGGSGLGTGFRTGFRCCRIGAGGPDLDAQAEHHEVEVQKSF